MIQEGMLEYVFERIRFQLQQDGGDAYVSKLDHEKGIVYVVLQGECVDCPMSAITLSQGIEKVLVEHVPGVERVLPDLDEMEDIDFNASNIPVRMVDDDGEIIGEKMISASELIESME